MDSAPLEQHAPSRKTLRGRSLTVKTLRAVAIVIGIALLGGIAYAALLSSPGTGVGDVARLVFLAGFLGVGVPASILVVFAWFMAQGSRLRARGEGLDLREDVRGPFKTTLLVRGQFRGRTARIFRDRVELDGVCSTPGVFEGKVLEALGKALSGEEPALATRSAAASLVALGVERLEMKSRRLIVYGGSAPAADLLPHALEIALAQVKIRFLPGQTPSARDCPYCRQQLGPLRDEPAVRCPSCEAQHHSECWQEHGGCAVFRCRRAPAPDRERPAPNVQVRERA